LKAIVVGSANTDLIIHVNNLPSLGNTEVGDSFKSGPGGKGANQSVCLSKLGTKTHLISRVGKDEFSSILLENIRRCGVKIDNVVIDEKHKGGIVFIIVDKTGNNTMIADFGSNLFLSEEDIEKASETFKDADLLILQFEVSEKANKRAIEIAESNDVPVVLNPAPMKKFDLSILNKINVITPNLFELYKISSFMEKSPCINSNENDVTKIIQSAKKLIDYGVKNVVVTLGKRGSIFVCKDYINTYGSFDVKQIDSTAAGDAFTASFATKFVEKRDIDQAINFATACAAISVTREGAMPSLPDLYEVEEFMSKNKIKRFE